MIIKEIDAADIDLVEIKTTNQCNPTPHCKVHGAMNKITVNEDGGGYWRCISVVSVTKVVKGNSIGYIQNDNVCRSGCCEVRK
jgi:hypothetical protein